MRGTVDNNSAREQIAPPGQSSFPGRRIPFLVTVAFAVTQDEPT